jgi:hypothetical protein
MVRRIEGLGRRREEVLREGCVPLAVLREVIEERAHALVGCFVPRCGRSRERNSH